MFIDHNIFVRTAKMLSMIAEFVAIVVSCLHCYSGCVSEPLAATVADTKGCYFVPAFTGLFCPYWRSDARGLVI